MGDVAPTRRGIIGANWKMNTTLPASIDLADAIVRLVGEVVDVDIVLCPPYPSLESVQRTIEGSVIQLGAQDVFWEDAGAFTGEVSGPMLRDVGCGWVIVGHSERRRLMGESSEIVNRKLHAALRNGLQAILAIGETREERHAGRTAVVCDDQLCQSLEGITAEHMAGVVVAYEPVWAIGTGETATVKQASEAHAHIRSVLARLFGDGVAQATRIQYGGSVTGKNAGELMRESDIDGALVGGASLKPDDFAGIVEAARETNEQ